MEHDTTSVRNNKYFTRVCVRVVVHYYTIVTYIYVGINVIRSSYCIAVILLYNTKKGGGYMVQQLRGVSQASPGGAPIICTI